MFAIRNYQKLISGSNEDTNIGNGGDIIIAGGTKLQQDGVGNVRVRGKQQGGG